MNCFVRGGGLYRQLIRVDESNSTEHWIGLLAVRFRDRWSL